MTKIYFGQLVIEYSKILTEGMAVADNNSLKTISEQVTILDWYIRGLLDERNMPLFPANDSEGNPKYIPANCYFMMGDNRFNSLDLRHSYDRKETALSGDDPQSVTYLSMMAPQYINKKYIIGKPVFRFWPLGRLGKV